ncbi:methylated-DNA--[protein]-cysteine S-methyltransferase [Paenarthrobacter aurescens]|uniref:Methylated-DNA--protein-cysteine methyltransferase n=1 Tax=Paenarthrobacter aurescens TaxID=43663 RepID=A0A4Y3NHP8_PAEAU|nr:methylated-DNA--[protein]-cysteine S-methyltransferase [Paenarthrobacter aurescens]MDO6141718.1 methylated-DNA--[protein]-cysteine S-methyltransferase [Paenarthrobacter aurescens]MDO6149481.1 methylated-DNA--[protein]-cysteine S-methyltransferase [Paenarthrobacter aurescens]MDO6156767.1 methylated-DNA--[protein]-cysteine S-methyltransferase [Paenarthrobacter aurescens]MDO6160753.1 methylated-DNA--[protein]-cysteine S-methyltransferase [Paenarthrobacter aurescens]GEB18631.1 methylated-DNA--p
MSSRHTTLDSPLGQLTLTARGEYLTGIFYEGHWHMPPADYFGDITGLDDPVFAQTRAELNEYLAGHRTAFELPLEAMGNPFQEKVWDRLKSIPFGETVSYGELAAELGDRHLAQAVGSAVGRNPISIVIPCHRVVGGNGQLTGYAGGLPNKRFLLELEEPTDVREGKLF